MVVWAFTKGLQSGEPFAALVRGLVYLALSTLALCLGLTALFLFVKFVKWAWYF